MDGLPDIQIIVKEEIYKVLGQIMLHQGCFTKEYEGWGKALLFFVYGQMLSTPDKI